MSDSSSAGGSGIVAGWYTDPYDSQQLRWWDGTAWTAHVAPPAAPAPAAEAAPVVEQAPTVDQAQVEQPTPVESQTFPSRRAMREALGEALVTQSLEPVDVPELEPAPIEMPVAAEPEAVQPEAVQPEAIQPEPIQPEPVQLETVEPAPVSAAQAGSEPIPQLWTPPQTEPGTAPMADPGPADTPFAEPGFTGSPFGTPNFTAQSAPAATAEPTPAPATQYSPPPTEPEIIDVVPLESAPTPAVTVSTGERTVPAEPVGGTFTLWVWLIVISPLLAAAIVGYVLATFTISGSPLILGASLLAPYLFVILFAAGDRSRLVAAGHDRPASFGWAALTAPIYLVQRAGQLRKEGSSGNLVLLLWLVAFVLAIAGIAGYGLLTHTALLPGLPQ